MANRLGGGRVADLNLPPGDDGEEAPPLAEEVDRISALPPKARAHIVSFLPLKSAISLQVASTGWYAFFTKSQAPRDFVVKLRIRSADAVPRLIDKLNRRGRGTRLLHFFVTLDGGEVRPGEFWFFLDYAASCGAENIHVDARLGPPALCFSFQRTSPRLVRLSLCGVRVTATRHPGAFGRSIPTLEFIRIQSTDLEDGNLRMILLWCPRLRVLDLRHCGGVTRVDLTSASAHLMSLIVAECPEVTVISATAAHDLRSFRYSGGYLSYLALPAAAYFGDLYMCFRRLKGPLPSRNWLHVLPNLSDLTVLTICSNALGMFSAMRKGGANTEWPKLDNLRSLRELQLLMFAMTTLHLSHIYGFLKSCSCSQLKKLFVQLPKGGKESFKDALRELGEEPPKYCLENLVMTKITNFKWQCNEIELVHFLFRQASNLQKMVLVAPQGVSPAGADILLLGKPPANAELLVLSYSSGAKIRAFHRYTFFVY
ncbi:hypothetical protein ACP70R_043979 [Stipagrostis hirtigluma subsp. patula]